MTIYTKPGDADFPIDDDIVSSVKGWSSNKINTELSGKAERSEEWVDGELLEYDDTGKIVGSGKSTGDFSPIGHLHGAANITVDTTNFGKNLDVNDDNVQKVADKVDDLILGVASNGDVNGPASSIDDEVVLMDGVTGKIIKGSGKNLSEYQETLVSGNNIKTVNGTSLLGTGNLEITAGSGGYAANIYLSDAASTINPSYKSLSYTPDSAQTISTITCNNNEVAGDIYLFDLPIGVDFIDAGTWLSTINTFVSNILGETKIRAEIFMRTPGGVETILFSFLSGEINYTSVGTINPYITKDKIDVDSTSYIGIKLYATTTLTSDVDVNIYIGDGFATFFNTPLALRHSQLRDRNAVEQHEIGAITDLQTTLDGKASTGNQTFTGDIFANNLSGINTGDQDLSGFVDRTTAQVIAGEKIFSDVTTFDDIVNLNSLTNMNSNATIAGTLSVTGNTTVKSVFNIANPSFSNLLAIDGTGTNVTLKNQIGGHVELQTDNASRRFLYNNDTPDNSQELVNKTYVDNKVASVNGGLVGTKEVDETDLADTRIIAYDDASGKYILIDKPIGGGGDTVNFEILTADKILVDGDDTIQMLDPNGANRNINLPVGVQGMRFRIKNNNDTYSAVEYLSIKDNGGTLFDKLYTGASRAYVFDGTNWLSEDGFGGSEGITDILLSIGVNSTGYGQGVGLGTDALGHSVGVAVGRSSKGYNNGASVGAYSEGYENGASLGNYAIGYNYGIAIGNRAVTSGNSNSYSGAIGWNFKNAKDNFLAFSKGTGLSDTTSTRIGFDFGETGKVAMEINDSSSAPAVTDNKLYSVGGELQWNGTPLGGGGLTSAISVENTAGFSPSASSTVKVPFNTEIYDLDGEFDSTTNYRFTANNDGIYNISSAMSWINASKVERSYRFKLYKNGTQIQDIRDDNSNFAFVQTLSKDIQLVAGDYLEFYVNQTSADAITVYGYATIHKL